MKNGKLKKFLKNSAEKVQVKDFSAQILEKFSTDSTPDEQFLFDEQTASRPVQKLRISAFRWGALVAVVVAVLLVPLVVLRVNAAPSTMPIGNAEKMLSYEFFALGNVVANQARNAPQNAAAQTEYVSADLTLVSEKLPCSDGDDEYRTIADTVANFIVTGNVMLYKDDVNVVCKRNVGGAFRNYEFALEVSFAGKNTYAAIGYTAYYNVTKTAEENKIDGVLSVDGVQYPVFGVVKNADDNVETEMSVVIGANERVSIFGAAGGRAEAFDCVFTAGSQVDQTVSLTVSSDGEPSVDMTVTEKDGAVRLYNLNYGAETVQCKVVSAAVAHNSNASGDVDKSDDTSSGGYNQTVNEQQIVVTVYATDGGYLLVFDDGKEIRI